MPAIPLPKMTEGHVSPIKYLIAGGVGGICTVIAGFPLDTIKVKLQTMHKIPGQPPLYTGTWDCARKTIQREGVLGLYKGMSAPVTTATPIFAISFFTFGLGKRLQMSSPDEELTPLQRFLAGAFSGIFTTVVTAPGERIKVLLQTQEGGTKPPKYKGPADVVKQLYKEGGMRSIFKGTCATLLRDVPSGGAYFMTYELIQRALTPEGADQSSIGLRTTMIAGGMAGIANWIVAMPADVLKNNLQTAPEGTYPNGMRDVFRMLMKEEGPLGLYKGVGPVMLAAFPANAACFVGFEVCLKLLNYGAPPH